MSGYYGSTAIFYAAILLIGFIGLLSSLSEFSAVELRTQEKNSKNLLGAFSGGRRS